MSAVTLMLIATPNVESSTAGTTAGFTSSHLVVSPPSARINTSAASPRDCARRASSKCTMLCSASPIAR